LLPLFMLSFFSYSQDILWERSYGGQHADYLFDAQPTADYGFILAGSSLSNKTGNKDDDNHGDLDYWIWKMSEKGDLVWQKSIGGSGFDLLQSIKNTRDGGFILAGTSSSGRGFQKNEKCKGLTDFWVIKLDASGSEQWQRTIGGKGKDELLCAFQTKDGGYMLGGSSSSDYSGNVLTGTNGTPQATKKADQFNKSERCRGNMDYWIVKLDKQGDVEWQKNLLSEVFKFQLKSCAKVSDFALFFLLIIINVSKVSDFFNRLIDGIKFSLFLNYFKVGDFCAAHLIKERFVELEGF
jgi:hypothetical protein